MYLPQQIRAWAHTIWGAKRIISTRAVQYRLALTEAQTSDDVIFCEQDGQQRDKLLLGSCISCQPLWRQALVRGCKHLCWDSEVGVGG